MAKDGRSKSSILYVCFAASAAVALFTMGFIIHFLDRRDLLKADFEYNVMLKDDISLQEVKPLIGGGEVRNLPLPNARTLLYQHTGPDTFEGQSTESGLEERARNGYLTGNASGLSFHPYPSEVDLRVIVIVYNRPKSLLKCLNSLNDAFYYGDAVSLEVWIDRNDKNDQVHTATLAAAKSFRFRHGQYHIWIQPTHVGIQGQWTNTWRPRPDTKEVGLILEDDITVSKYFWKWLKLAHHNYDDRSDVSGYSLSHPGISHATGTTLDIPRTIRIYGYRLLCTWGFSPHAKIWREYQNWFYKVENEPGFEPLVPGILPTLWYQGEKRFDRERHLWEMWHIFYANQNSQYTVMLNSLDFGLLAVNRHELGLHDGRTGTGARDPLLTAWNDTIAKFPKLFTKIDYDGLVMTSA